MTQLASDVIYEQPLTERVRTFLRLELLFRQHLHHASDPGEFGTRATLQSLLDILVVLSRTDLKNEILKELADQFASLTSLASKDGVDPSRLQKTLGEIASAQQGLQQTTQFAATALRSHDFLISVLNRSTVPGGATAFDLPTYHHWLSRPAQIQQDLASWHREVQPFRDAINLYLGLLRKSTRAEPVVATSGMFVRSPQGPCSLLRVTLPADQNLYPEISAGKHRFSVRLMLLPDIHSRPQQFVGDVAFTLQCCNL